MSAILNTGNDPARCAQHNALDCPCTDAPVLRLLRPLTPVGRCTIRVERGDRHPDEIETTADEAEQMARDVLLDWRGDDRFEGLEVVDERGERFVLEGGELVHEDDAAGPVVGGCDCGNGLCHWCGSPPPEAA